MDIEHLSRAGGATLFNRLAKREAMNLLGIDPEKPRRKVLAAPANPPTDKNI